MQDSSKHILVTGAAGFIGMHVAHRLLDQGHRVTGIDNMNAYYPVALKEARLASLTNHEKFQFHRMELDDTSAVDTLFADHADQPFDRVIHLAAQAGVRYSLEQPRTYVRSNISGFMNILEACRHHRIAHLVFASSSSVYGLNARMPFSEHHGTDHPVSLYAATKKSNEMMAHAYAHLFGIPCTGLRFFTVYGPWGRPDMAPWLFTDAILSGKTIRVFNHGNMLRDFTYIDDIVSGVSGIMDHIPQADPDWQGGDPARSSAPYRVYNIGNNQPVELSRFISAIEQATGREAIKQFLPMQPGDVFATAADIQDLQQACGFHPETHIEQGMQRFVDWFRSYHQQQ